MNSARLRDAALLAAGGLLLALYLQGLWGFGFIAWVPWLLLLDRHRGLWHQLGLACLLTLAYVAIAFAWFGAALGRYTELGPGMGFGLLLLLAPLFQPQILGFVLVRYWVGQRLGALWAAWAGASAWVGLEWALPKLLGDSYGHGLYPALWLRQAAALGGVALLTLVLLLANEALAQAVARRRLRPLAWLLLPLLLAAYGAQALRAVPPGAELPQLRVALVQANIADLEARRRTQGTESALRELLDAHLAMSWDAVERQGADAVLWSETVYPTSFGNPKNALGAAYDAELLATLRASGRPFVFGTYERRAEGEYNAAAFVDPERGLLGFYRKTHLFPLTEIVPTWLDGPSLRRLLPWLGNWRAGEGPRLMPLRLRDGRELPVQALICRDDTQPMLAIAAARLGAQALFTLSNDSWFSDQPEGARWHLAVAAFRSVETRLPQYRVTTTGVSALIDAQGRVQASAGLNERALVVGALAVPVPEPTLMVRWGDWLGGMAWIFLATLLLGLALPWRRLHGPGPGPQPAAALPAQLLLMPAPVRLLAALLRGGARLVLLGLGLALALDEGLRSQTLLQLRVFVGGVLLPEAVALCLMAAFRVQASLTEGLLQLARGGQVLQLPLAQLRGLSPWRWPMPQPGASLQGHDGRVWHLAGVEPAALGAVLAAAGVPPTRPLPAYQRARAALPLSRWQAPLLKFGLLPLLLALPAFHLHQHIAYGSGLGEFYTHGLRAYVLAFGLWWGAWLLGVALCAALLRAAVEALSWLAAAWRPGQALLLRWGLERAALLLLYLGLPVWLGLRLLLS